MTRKLYLHIGFPKTGSTSIQTFLHKNIKLLEKRGICYPDIYDSHSGHSSLVAYAAIETNAKISPFHTVLAENRIGVKLESSKYRASVRRLLEKTLENTNVSKFVISSEAFVTTLRRPRQILALKQFLSLYFSEIYIVVYLRSQESWIASRLSQSVKLGGIHKIEEIAQAPLNNYYRTLNPWWEVFGEKNMNIRILDKKHMYKGDLFSDIFSLMELEIDPDFKIPAKKNLSLSADMINFLLEFNRQVPYFLDGNIINPERNGLVEIIEAYSAGKKRYTLNSGMVKSVRSQYNSSNELLRKKFFPDLKELFELNQREIGDVDVLSINKTIEIAAYLWKQKKANMDAL